MIALAHACPTDNLHVVDLPYRLSSWARDDPGNIGLWVDPTGRLLVWAVLQTPFWTIDYVFHPNADAHLHRELLAWADHRARQLVDTPYGRPCWFVMAFASQTDRIRDLEEAGFASQADVGEDSWSKVLMQRSAQIPVAEHALPAGFIIRPLAGEKEVAAYVELHRAVFESKNMTGEWRARTLRRPEYLPDLDLVAVAPDGRLAGFCVGWLSKSSEGNPVGQIEPLGVHADFRGLGLGRAILSEGLRRLYLRGAERVCMETDAHRNAALDLCEAVGFRPLRDVLVYRQDYGRAQG
jgi:mycothiol synthase